ncbi:P2Y purinoceptor 2-like [Babylonia areolata]|uniref:P2Y purinoceptor 2-like n=1 Tax=Babylonia areolata TaxID=304850 RepID=UPI003FD5139B
MSSLAGVTSAAKVCNGTDVTNGTASGDPVYIDYFTNIYSVIYAVGFAGNLFSLVVWVKADLRFTPVLYFITFCISDSLVLAMHPLETFHTVHVPVVCPVVHVLFLAVEVFEIFLVLALSLQRYWELFRPRLALSYGRTKRLIPALFVLALLCSSGEAYMWDMDGGQCRLRRTTLDIVLAYGAVVLLVLFMVPLVVVLVCNILLHCRIRRARKHSEAYSVHMVPDRHRLNCSVTILTCYLAICEITYAVVHSYHDFAAAEAETNVRLAGRLHNMRVNSLPLLVLEIIALTSYAVDVAIFTFFSKTFRHEVKELYARCRCLTQPPPHPHPQSQLRPPRSDTTTTTLTSDDNHHIHIIDDNHHHNHHNGHENNNDIYMVTRL